MTEDLTPVLIGAGQLTQRDVDDPAEAREPLELMVATARAAAEDAGATVQLLRQVDSIAVVNILGWQYANAPRLLAERLGAQPAEEIYTTVGGNTPQSLVNETAAKIAAGRVGLVLLAGAEAIRTLRRAGRARTPLHWTTGGAGTPTVIGDPRPGNSELEIAHGLHLPSQIYPLFENALRAHRGLGLDEHSRKLGELCQRFTAVAARNPYAWFREARSADEIRTVTPENRMIAFPYPKLMNALIDVDQSATVLMTSVGRARALNIPESRWVYLWGCADAHDHWFVSERSTYHASPAIRRAAQVALEMAGRSADRIDLFDLYSCFPCAVQLARDAIGVAENDPRELTVTGGLAYHGGPGNNYTMHAIATMMEKLRAKPGTIGLVTGLGWYVTKHSVGVYSAAPRETGPWARTEPAAYQAELDAIPHPELVAAPEGRATIETYTVLHDREGRPEQGIIIGRMDDGRRFLANTPDDPAVLQDLMRGEAVGRGGRVSPAGSVNRFVPDA